MDKPEMRRNTLRRLIKEKTGGNVARFCEIYDLPVVYIRALVKPASKKSFGDKSAEKLEAQIGLPEDYLLTGADSPPDDVYGQIKALLRKADFLTDAERKAHLALLEAHKNAKDRN